MFTSTQGNMKALLENPLEIWSIILITVISWSFHSWSFSFYAMRLVRSITLITLRSRYFDSWSFSSFAMRLVRVWLVLLMLCSPTPVNALSDDEGVAASSSSVSQNPQGQSGDAVDPQPSLKRKRSLSFKPLSMHDVRSCVARAVQGKCQCSQVSKEAGRPSCLRRFAHVIDEVAKIRHKIHTLHKLDSDTFASLLLNIIDVVGAITYVLVIVCSSLSISLLNQFAAPRLPHCCLKSVLREASTARWFWAGACAAKPFANYWGLDMGAIRNWRKQVLPKKASLMAGLWRSSEQDISESNPNSWVSGGIVPNDFRTNARGQWNNHGEESWISETEG